jgi:hypothetical protein
MASRQHQSINSARLTIEAVGADAGSGLPPVQIQPAYGMAAFCDAFGVGRSLAYEEIAAGRLRAFKIGARTLIAGEDALRWRDSYRRVRPVSQST